MLYVDMFIRMSYPWGKHIIIPKIVTKLEPLVQHMRNPHTLDKT
jgi:hypothetical protein